MSAVSEDDVMFSSTKGRTTGTNLAERPRFPYGSLAAVLLTAFALGCVVANGLLQQLVAGAWEVSDPVPLATLAVVAVSFLVMMLVQVSYLVERARRQPVAVPEDVAGTAIRAEMGATAAGTDGRSRVARIEAERVPLAVGADGNGSPVPALPDA